jgi:hypothetical protein
MRANFAGQSRVTDAKIRPICSERSRRWSESTAFKVSSAAAQATGLPPKVPPKTARIGRIHDFGSPRDRGKWQASGDRFRGQNEIGFDSETFARKQRTSPAESGLDLVGDQENDTNVLVAAFLNISVALALEYEEVLKREGILPGSRRRKSMTSSTTLQNLLPRSVCASQAANFAGPG